MHSIGGKKGVKLWRVPIDSILVICGYLDDWVFNLIASLQMNGCDKKDEIQGRLIETHLRYSLIMRILSIPCGEWALNK